MKTLRLFALVAFSSLVGCGGSGGSKTGITRDGDVTSTGGTVGDVDTGLGGATANGGTTGAGGVIGSGGLTATGGTAGTIDGGVGGRTGTGGRTATSARDAGSDTITGTGGGDSGLDSSAGTGGSTVTGGRTGSGGRDAGLDSSTSTGGSDSSVDGRSASSDAGLAGDTGLSDTGAASSVPAGWLYTVPKDNKIYVSNGTGGTVWMGRGVNIDDLFLCGYNNQLQMTNPTGEAALLGIVSNLMAEWKPTLIRTSLGMNSYAVVSWLASSVYKTGMTNVINKIGTYPGTYVLLTLRSDTTMVNTDGSVCGQGDDAVCLPATATDDVYRELVASFANAPFVIFGIANEPGGMDAKDATISNLMSHAAGVIRSTEDTLGVPHHLIAVQGNQWTSKIGFYDTAPLPYDNVVYEYHSYPPEATGTYGYTQSSIPVMIGEYGPLNSDQSFLSAFLKDVEAKQIPNIAWSVSPYSNCAPDLVSVTRTTTLTPNTWGTPIKQYLLSH